MVEAVINYVARTDFRQRYYANDHARDTVLVAGRTMPIANARSLHTDLDREGFRLVTHHSQIADFLDSECVAAAYPQEIVALLQFETGADSVVVTAPPIIRFSECSTLAGQRDNSMPARFAHIDATAATSAGFAARLVADGRRISRYAHYNVWRCISGSPQDVPLALCDARHVATEDCLIADAIFDPPGGLPEWSFESWIIAHNERHRWFWFPDMNRSEAIIFKTSDSRFTNPVPHVAFDNPEAPPDCHPRISIEMRAFACWFD